MAYSYLRTHDKKTAVKHHKDSDLYEVLPRFFLGREASGEIGSDGNLVGLSLTVCEEFWELDKLLDAQTEASLEISDVPWLVEAIGYAVERLNPVRTPGRPGKINEHCHAEILPFGRYADLKDEVWPTNSELMILVAEVNLGIEDGKRVLPWDKKPKSGN